MKQTDLIFDCALLEMWDVLCGRHQRSITHPGTRRFRSIIQSYCWKYQTTRNRAKKSMVVKEVISIVQAEGGRFLRENEADTWAVLTHEQVYEKVSHALRSAKAKDVAESKHRQGAKEADEAFWRVRIVQQQLFRDLVEGYRPSRSLSWMQHLQQDPNEHRKSWSQEQQGSTLRKSNCTEPHLPLTFPECDLMWVDPAEAVPSS